MSDEAPQVRRKGPPGRGVLATVLTLEAIVIALAVPVAIMVSDVGRGTALGAGLGLAVACIVVAGMLGRPWGVTAGWLIQLAAIALGFVVPAMFFLGVMFAFLWFLGLRLGREIEAKQQSR